MEAPHKLVEPQIVFLALSTFVCHLIAQATFRLAGVKVQGNKTSQIQLLFSSLIHPHFSHSVGEGRILVLEL